MKLFVPLLPLVVFGLGAAQAPSATITVRNALPLARRAETISLPLAQLPAAVQRLDAASLRVHAMPGSTLLVSQLLDKDGVGTGVVVAPGCLLNYQDHRSSEKDRSQLYMVTKPKQNTVVFYAGFGWQKSEQFASAAAWDAYLAEYAQRLASPLAVSWR